jgi:hypothetical protein
VLKSTGNRFGVANFCDICDSLWLMRQLNIRQIPDQVYKEAKQQAISEDKPLYQWVIDALRNELKRCDPSRRWPPHEKI